MHRIIRAALAALVLAIGVGGEARAACVYFGGYPWSPNGCLTSADLNAAFARALTPPTVLGPGAAAANLGYMPLNPANNLTDVANPAAALANLGGIGLNSPAFTGSPTAPTQALSDATTKLATTAFVNNQGFVVGGSAGSITAPMLHSGAVVSSLGYTPANVASNLSDLASAPTARSNLGLGSIATQSAAAVDITGASLITGLPVPVNPTDAATKGYVDSVAVGLTIHASVIVATNGSALPANTYNNGSSGVGATLTENANGALTVDGHAAATSDRILVKDESAQANNGVYTVTATGSPSAPYVLTRATDFNQTSNITTNSYFFVSLGTANAATAWLMTTTGSITPGTTAIVFTQFSASTSYSAGSGLNLSGTTFSIPSAGVSSAMLASGAAVANLASGSITSSLLASGAAAANLGYTAANVADNLSDLASIITARNNLLPSGTVTAAMLTGGAAVSNIGYTPANVANNLSDLANIGTARLNLGLGATATLGVGTGLTTSGSNLILANPSATTIGGIKSTTGVASEWISSISTSGVPGLTQPSFSDLLSQATLTQLPTLTANTVLGALTATTPSGLPMPPCSAALTWTSGTGFGCNTGLGTGNVSTTGGTTGFVPAWSGANALSAGIAVGSSGANTILETTGGGTVGASVLPTPTASTLGGIESTAGASHQFVSSISTAGVPGLTQPAFSDLTGAAGIAQGGTSQTSAPASRGATGLNIDEETLKGDTAYAMVSTDRYVATSAALTAARIWTLPSASALNPGQTLSIVDQAGGVTGANTLSIARSGSDTINGGTSSIVLNAAHEGVTLISDGTSKWTATALQAQFTAPTHQFVNANSLLSGPSSAQPAFTDVSGQATLAQLPTMAANTVLGALTATTPSGLPMPSCAFALSFVQGGGGGFGCNTSLAFSVASNAALKALVGWPSGTTVLRQSFWPGIAGGGAATYTFTSANCAAPDNGLEVAPTSGGGCWLYNSPGGVPSTDLWGTTGSASTITCAVSSVTLTCSGGTSDFAVGQSIAVIGAGPTSTAATPSLSVAPVNGSGTTYFYTVAPIDSSMGVGAALTPVSVSGGPDLGTAHDMNITLTGNTHSNTTVDNLEIGGVACTPTTCPLGVGGVISGAAIASGTTITAINSATSITISLSALTTTSATAVGTSAPAGGVYNQLTVTGSSPSYAVYEGPSATLSAMTCVGVHTNLTTVNGGLWNDFGATHVDACPSWIPATAPASASGDVLLTTITSIAGNTITVAATATQTLASTTVLHNDQPALAAGLTAGFGLTVPCGTFNIFAGLTQNTGSTIRGSGCSTIAGWGVGFDDLTISSGASDSSIYTTEFDDTQKASGFYLSGISAPSHVIVDSVSPINECNGIQLYGMNNTRLSNIASPSSAAIGVRCDVALYMWGDNSRQDIAPSIYNSLMGNTTHSTNAYGIIIDGNVNSTVLNNVSLQDFPRGALIKRNTVGASHGPNGLDAYQFAINVESGPPIVIMAGGADLEFSRLFLQGSSGDGTDCIFIASGVSGTIEFGNGAQIFGCDKNGLNTFSPAAINMGDGSTRIYGNNQLFSTFDKVRLNSGAGPAVIKLSSGDAFSSNVNSATKERCGIDFAPGYGSGVSLPIGSPFADVTTAAPGMLAPVCDASGIFGLILVDGQFNSPRFVTSSAGGTLSVVDMLGNQNGTTPSLYISGNVLGTPVTWTTPTASALVAAVQNANTSQLFHINIFNQGNSVVTLAGGTGVTITGTATTAQTTGPHAFTCWFTNTGTPAMTCTG